MKKNMINAKDIFAAITTEGAGDRNVPYVTVDSIRIDSSVGEMSAVVEDLCALGDLNHLRVLCGGSDLVSFAAQDARRRWFVDHVLGISMPEDVVVVTSHGEDALTVELNVDGDSSVISIPHRIFRELALALLVVCVIKNAKKGGQKSQDPEQST